MSNPDASALTTAAALSYWASNRMVQLARRNLGWSADLGGTGMCLTGEALAAVGGFGTSATEDQELVARLVLAGYPGGVASRCANSRRETRLARGGGPSANPVGGRQAARCSTLRSGAGPARDQRPLVRPVRSGRAAHATGSDLPCIADRRTGGRCCGLFPSDLPAGMVAVGRSGGRSGACSAAFPRPGRSVRPLPVALPPS